MLRKDMLCNIVFEVNGKEKGLIALIDTGNMLKDPITKKPVVVVEKNSLKRNYRRYNFRKLR